ncbi:prepilin peptidase [Actinomadura atramentaria]|uniref:prepilin peptidase n=1 Tax=Actinomadura atramentaria TaxID=1990 RepID=UPI00035E7F49|nr:A24 family peptidase [Actinomadura atramentaria]
MLPALLALTGAGAAAGWRLAALAAPYTGAVPRRRRAASAAVTALICALLARRFGADPVLPALLYLAVVGTLLSFVDAAVHRLPDPFTLPSYPVGAILLAAAAPFTENGWRHLLWALCGMAAMLAVFGVQRLAAPSALGMGDVKLSGVTGLYLGWSGAAAWCAGLLATVLLAGVAGLVAAVARRSLRGGVPFGPYMLAGTLLGVLTAAA